MNINIGFCSNFATVFQAILYLFLSTIAEVKSEIPDISYLELQVGGKHEHFLLGFS